MEWHEGDHHNYAQKRGTVSPSLAEHLLGRYSTNELFKIMSETIAPPNRQTPAAAERRMIRLVLTIPGRQRPVRLLRPVLFPGNHPAYSGRANAALAPSHGDYTALPNYYSLPTPAPSHQPACPPRLVFIHHAPWHKDCPFFTVVGTA